MIPAVAYMRFSGMGQADGDSIRRQSEAIAEYAASHGYEITQTYEEHGVPGKTESDDRPAMSQMFQDLIHSKTGVQVVIIEKVDRLARDLIVQESIIAKFQSYRLTLVSTCEPDLCSDDPSRVFIRQVLGAVAQLDRSLIVRKTRAARERIRQNGGKCEGRKAFGFRPGEREIIREICEWRDYGLGAGAIAFRLNNAGMLTRTGCRWTGVQVKRILEREANEKTTS